MNPKVLLRASVQNISFYRPIQYVFFVYLVAWIFATPALANLPNAPSCSNSSIAGTSCPTSADPGVTPIWNQSRRYIGNPVDVISGNKFQRELDYQSIGSRLHLSRYYNSALSDTNMGLGHGWRHSYFVKLVELDSDRRQIEQADGRTIEFTRLSGSSSLYMAHSVQDGYLFEDNQARWFGVTDEHAQQLLFEYSELGSSLRSYSQANGELDAHLKAITLPSGDQLRYSYDGAGNLTTVEAKDERVSLYKYNDAVYPNHLTSISGPKKQQRNWKYNHHGAVESYSNSTTAEYLSVTYFGDASLDHRGETLVEHGSGRQEQYHWQRNSVSQKVFVTRVDSQTDIDGTVFSYSPEPDIAQQAADVHKAHDLYLQRVNTSGGKPVVITEMTTLEDVDLSNLRVLPIENTLNSRVVLRINGSDLEFEIHADRNGTVTQITFGNTSLKEMARRWASGDIVRCDAEPLFQRALQQPKPDQSCIEDFVFLVELSNRISELNQSGSYNEIQERSSRSAATNTGANQPCLSNPFSTCSELERNFELAQLTSCAYKVIVVTCGQDWESVDPVSVNLTESDFNYKSFSARLFLNNISGEYVLAFRGTDDKGDWKDNLLQAVGVSTTQYRQAVKLAAKVKQQLSGQDLLTAGHSLGGGLATAAALQIEVEGHVFNPAALLDKTARQLGLNNYTDASKFVSVTTMHGDILTRVQNWVYAESAFYEWYGEPNTHTRLSKPDRAWLNNFKSGVWHYRFQSLNNVAMLRRKQHAFIDYLFGYVATRPIHI